MFEARTCSTAVLYIVRYKANSDSDSDLLERLLQHLLVPLSSATACGGHCSHV